MTATTLVVPAQRVALPPSTVSPTFTVATTLTEPAAPSARPSRTPWRPSAEDRALAEEIAHLELLTAEEEVRLATDIEVGVYAGVKLAALDPDADPQLRADLAAIARTGELAFERMIRANLRLVTWWARRRLLVGANGGLDLADLVSAGTLGLIRAVHKFDIYWGTKFSTYASWWIRQFQQRAVARNRVTTLSAAAEEEARRVAITRADLANRLGRVPGADEVAAALGLSTVAVLELDAASGWTATSLDEHTWAKGDITDSTVGDLIADDAPDPLDELVRADAAAHLSQLLAGLDARQRKVVVLRFGLSGQLPMSTAEVAAHLGVPAHRVEVAETAALAALRAGADRDLLAVLTGTPA